MAGFPERAVDFILTDPPYLVGFRDRQGRTIAGDKTDEWLQPACHEMYRVLKKDALMVNFYGWNRVDRYMAAWKNAGFSVVGHRRVNRIALLFADELIGRELTARPDYYRGKSHR
jgi:site-specific DNA-methyltransferase (adenine-specific)